MTHANALDLSGEWTGIYNYPVALPPVAFEAVLQDLDGRISGTISEVTETLSRPAQRLDSVIDGRRDGLSVQFIKMYEQADHEFDVVHYSGSVDPEGAEIAGTWALAGMSGTFLMVRRPGATEAVEQEAEATIDR